MEFSSDPRPGLTSSSKLKFRDQYQSIWLDRTPGKSNPQTNHKALTTKIPKVSTVNKGKRYAFPKKDKEQLLGVLEEVLRNKRRNHPPPSYTFKKGYLPIPSKVNQKYPSGLPRYEP